MTEKIYIDPISYHCSRIPSENAIMFETEYFTGKCDAFVEGYYIVPEGYSLTLPDEKILYGEMIAPWKDYAELDNVQREYERQLLVELQENSIPRSDLEAAYQEGVNSAYD